MNEWKGMELCEKKMMKLQLWLFKQQFLYKNDFELRLELEYLFHYLPVFSVCHLHNKLLWI